MTRSLSILLVLTVLFIGIPAGAASAEGMPSLDLPPGIAAQAQPLVAAMMARMQQMGMSPAQMQMMMADMQALANQLPPGIFLQLLRLMPQLDRSDMMELHRQIRQEGLLLEPPGQILVVVKHLAR
jgi:hypothetical protein